MACTADEFKEILGAETFVDVEKLREFSKFGIPDGVRGQVWAYLLGVSQPIKSQVDNQALPKAYQAYLNPPPEQDRTTGELLIKIRFNIDRFCADLKKPEKAFFQKPETKKTLENILVAMINYTNSEILSNAATVYLLAPFVYLIPKPELAFFCFESLLGKIEEKLPLQRLPHKVGQLMMLLRSLQPELSSYFEESGLQPNDWAQSWLQFLLAKELPLASLLPLWDTYFSEGLDLHIYVCLALLAHCSEELMELGDVELKHLLRHLPHLDMVQIISEAYNIRDECTEK